MPDPGRPALLLLLALLSCGPEPGDHKKEPVVLGRVGEVQITDADFEEALQRLEAGSLDRPLEEWRAQFQVLIDKQLLLHEARARGLEADSGVVRAVQDWERARLIEALLEREMGEALSWDEQELAAFFRETGAESEIRLRRLAFQDRDQALKALKQVRGGMEFGQVLAARGDADSSQANGGWVNALALTDERLAPLFLLAEGAVELVEAEGLYFLVEVAQRRRVSLEERRSLAERALRKRKEQQANLAYLKRLTERYQVRLDTAGLRQTMEGAAPGQTRLVKSALGDWTLDEYRQTLAWLEGEKGRPPASLAELGFQVTRAYAVVRLLPEEAKGQGLYQEIAQRGEKLREQKIVEALWQREVFSRVQVAPAEVSAFYQANRERYAALATDQEALYRRVVEELHDAKAAPLFDEYIARLRHKYAGQVAVDEERLGKFVARKRQATSPLGR